MTKKRHFAYFTYTRSVPFLPDFNANKGGIDVEHAGWDLEGCKSMLNNLGKNRIEQVAKADLLAVMLFADKWLIVRKK